MFSRPLFKAKKTMEFFHVWSSFLETSMFGALAAQILSAYGGKVKFFVMQRIIIVLLIKGRI